MQPSGKFRLSRSLYGRVRFRQGRGHGQTDSVQSITEPATENAPFSSLSKFKRSLNRVDFSAFLRYA